MENFLPRDGKKRVILNRDGTVQWFVVTYESRDLFAQFTKSGWLIIRETPYSPVIKIAEEIREKMRAQLLAVTGYYAQKSDFIKPLVTGIIKPWWSDDLVKCGVIFLPDGKVGITLRHWHGKADGDKRIILQRPLTIFKAIEMQDEIMRRYKNQFDKENGFNLDVRLTALLNRWHIVEPVIELRHAQLVWANKQMAKSIKVAHGMLMQILKKTPVTNQDLYGELFGDLVRLAYYLENNWANPYAEAVQFCLEEIYRAKRLARKVSIKNITEIQIYLNSARLTLNSLVDSIYRDNAYFDKLVMISPIHALNEIDCSGLRDEVMARAKKKMPKREFYPLVEMLAIAIPLLDKTKAPKLFIAVPRTSRSLVIRQRAVSHSHASPAAGTKRKLKKKNRVNSGLQSTLDL